MLPLSAMSQERRYSQKMTNMTSKNAERQSRNEALLDPAQQGTRDTWYTTHVTTHERLFPFNDNLTTVMFIVAGDPREAQRERLTSSLFSQVNVTDYTLEAVKTVFLWNYSVRRKAQWRVLLSACVDNGLLTK